jgi:hypothetical protein
MSDGPETVAEAGMTQTCHCSAVFLQQINDLESRAEELLNKNFEENTR